jgi:hypothetical protein
MSSSPTPTDKTACSKRQLRRKESTKKGRTDTILGFLVVFGAAVLAVLLFGAFVVGLLWGLTS